MYTFSDLVIKGNPGLKISLHHIEMITSKLLQFKVVIPLVVGKLLKMILKILWYTHPA